MFAFNSVVIVVFVIGFVILLLFVVLDFLGLVFCVVFAVSGCVVLTGCVA